MMVSVIRCSCSGVMYKRHTLPEPWLQKRIYCRFCINLRGKGLCLLRSGCCSVSVLNRRVAGLFGVGGIDWAGRKGSGVGLPHWYRCSVFMWMLWMACDVWRSDLFWGRGHSGTLSDWKVILQLVLEFCILGISLLKEPLFAKGQCLAWYNPPPLTHTLIPCYYMFTSPLEGI